jgi:methylated-DNA-[protein]-cysteine S-methyltransferase
MMLRNPRSSGRLPKRLFASAPRSVPVKDWVRLTRFQQIVYLAVCRIPRGEVRSYQWVAEQIGHPRSARAVGNALHQNPFAPHVPCHRIVRADGSLGGYSGGSSKKRALLKHEGWQSKR